MSRFCAETEVHPSSVFCAQNAGMVVTHLKANVLDELGCGLKFLLGCWYGRHTLEGEINVLDELGCGLKFLLGRWYGRHTLEGECS